MEPLVPLSQSCCSAGQQTIFLALRVHLLWSRHMKNPTKQEKHLKKQNKNKTKPLSLTLSLPIYKKKKEYKILNVNVLSIPA